MVDMKKIGSLIVNNKIIFTSLWAAGINFIIECFSRRGLIMGVVHLFTAPYIFLINTLIIAFTLSFMYLFKRRRFALFMISFLWITAGVIDFILQSFRKTPFTANDFTLIGDGIRILHTYVNMFGIIMMLAGIMAAVTGIIYYWRRSSISVQKIQYVRTIGSIGILWLLVYAMLWIGFKTGQLEPRFGNITTAYNRFGFAYCFSNSIFDNGIDKPDSYREEDFSVITEESEAGTSEEITQYPNIIFLQLESFMNPYLLKDVIYSQNPAPNFTRLADNYPSGYISVPSFGAGTANTEFEIITGMNLDDFGTGEYPYKTILKNTACESICYDLKGVGYKAHAVHNNDGSFYGRNKVFANLGFDTFTSIEYMGETIENPVGWAKDNCLVPNITKILDSTAQSDFIYAISVQGHGDYPKNYEELEEITGNHPMRYDIKVRNFIDDESRAGYEYYLDQIREMDDFIAELINVLSKRKEDTILVIYGDHMPGFAFTDEMMETGDIYKSQYVIWSNRDFGFEDMDMEAFRLSSYIMGKLEITDGVINRFHQNHSGDEDYLSKLTLLEYDILYGEKRVYGNQDIYTPTELKMGISDIYITKAYNYNERICVEGCNFNKYSYVSINGKEYKTACINPHTLVVVDEELKDGDVITVVQHGKDGIELSRTGEFTYHPE